MGVLGAICDGNAERREEFSSKYSVPSYSTIDELLDTEDFDAVFVCTPTTTHIEVASCLIEAKKHIFVEKPMILGCRSKTCRCHQKKFCSHADT